MSPLLLVLLYLLPCVSGLPFYNGFYYSNNPNGWNTGNSPGEGGQPPGSGSLLRRVTRTCPGSCWDKEAPGRDRGQGMEPAAPSLSGPCSGPGAFLRQAPGMVQLLCVCLSLGLGA